MGETANLRCPKCGLSGDGVVLGHGMSPIWRFVENRLFYCEKCSRLASAMVLRRVGALRGELPTMDAKPWRGDARLTFMPSELARFLIALKTPPQCACGSWLRGSVGLDDKVTPCPNCFAMLVVEQVGNWD
jgi:hypothetical protein